MGQDKNQRSVKPWPRGVVPGSVLPPSSVSLEMYFQLVLLVHNHSSFSVSICLVRKHFLIDSFVSYFLKARLSALSVRFSKSSNSLFSEACFHVAPLMHKSFGSFAVLETQRTHAWSFLVYAYEFTTVQLSLAEFCFVRFFRLMLRSFRALVKTKCCSFVACVTYAEAFQNLSGNKALFLCCMFQV